MVGLADQAHKLPSMVSGGQQQRAAIVRALANDPPLIVADEPTGNLDTATAHRVFDLFHQFVADGKTMVVVTHDKDLAQEVPRKVEIVDGQIVSDRIRMVPGNAMGVLRDKIWRDLWENKGRTIQVVLIIAIGTFAIGMIIGTRQFLITGMQESWRSVRAGHDLPVE